MKRKHFFLALIVIALASGVYFFKDEIFKPKHVKAWSFVPRNAVSVWESNATIEVWNRFINTDHWGNLSSIPAFGKIDNDLNYLDSLTGSNGNLDKILQNGQFLISIHTISRNQFDNVFYLELSNEEFRDIALQLTNAFQKKGDAIYSERTYHDQLIIEIQDKSANKVFSYFVKDNFLVASFTPFLVEDAIRTYRREISNFRQENAEAFELASLEFDAGNLYLNLKNLSSYAGLFFGNQEEDFLQPFKHLDGTGFMDIDFDKNFIFANGFLVPRTDSSYLSVFKNQRPVTTGFSNFIPGNTAKVFYQCFIDAKEWHQNVREYWADNDPAFVGQLDSLSNKLDFDFDRTLSWMGSQLILIDLESVDDSPEKLILAESNDVHESLNQLNRITEQVNEASGDTLYYENYGDITIRLLNLSEYPSKLYGKWYQGFQVTYYALIDPFVIMANDVEPIKQLIDDRESENTWGQSISKSEFVTNTLDESNIGLMISTPKAWNHLKTRLAPYWQKGWTNYERNIKQVELASLQISRSSDKYYGSVVMKNRSGISRDISRSGARRILSTGIGSRLVRKPKVTRNHRDGSWEMLTLDSTNRLSLIDGRGTLLWQQFLESPIQGNIYQLDFYKNRRLQYLVATDSLLHVIDRNGEYIENYPKNIADISTEVVSVIDYDNSKNYRFMLSENGGDIYLLDKEGNRLEGWSPKSFSGRFSIYPFHLRVRGRDVFIGVKENGEVIGTNRRGETLNGFPLDLDTRIGGDIYYQVKSGFDRTLFTVVSEEGEIIQFNLEGKIKDRSQIYRPATDTRFRLVRESSRKSYVIARQDLNRLAILDMEGELLFEKDYFTNDPFIVQYYNFGAGQDMIIVSNAEPGKALIYDDSGTLMVPQLDSEFPVSVVHYESRSLYHVYTASADSLFIHSIQE